ncbi:rod shape-determining protein MreC [Nocardioides sp. HDW12B]|uniref:rod shape-determining protein MreC n=1 Tax=Nocardioides sp. HDW12B TaxID=2714939 RepID=UPI001F0E3718|nr:rod shape-determining protein MreC [Nocardioides sp. HDW12B]
MALKDSRSGAGRSVVAVLALACVTTMVVDYQGQDDSPFQPVRRGIGDLLAPAQEGTAVVARPLHDIPGFFESSKDLRADVARLEAENANLRGQVATTSEVRYRAAELDGLLAASRTADLALVPARVVAMGPAQAFSHTVTIDAGTSSGVHADMTVINNAGLVGRVLHASRSTATILLVVDEASVVGARLGSNAEVGFLRGRGEIDGDTRLDLDLVDNSETPGEDDVVVTWGSRSGGPYVAGIPIGSVGSVYSSPREQSKHAVITPFVDFSSLDLVGVVVDGDTQGDRPVIRAGEVPEEDR